MSLKQTFMNDATDLAWLLTTHLKGRWVPLFRSFILYGNEDAPVRLDLYASVDPNHDDPYFRVDFQEEK